MPYKPHKRIIKRKDKGVPLSTSQLEHLIFGWTWIDNDFPFESEEHRRQCWERHKDQIMAMMTDDHHSTGLHPYLLVGMRPSAMWEYEPVPPLKRDQSIPEYLDEHGMWLTDEKRRHVRMMERKEKDLKRLHNVKSLEEFRDRPNY